MSFLKSFWQFFKKYPYSICLYVIYIAFIGRLKYVDLWLRNQNNMPHSYKLTDGEGIMYGYFFATIWGVIFAFITMGCLGVYKNHQPYYGWLLALIIIPLFLMWQL